MWIEIAEGLILLGSFVYHRWIEDHPSGPKPPQLTLPRVDTGVPYPLVYGRVRIRTPILIWSGNYLAPGQTFTRRQDGTTQVSDHYCFDAVFHCGLPFFGGQADILGVSAGDSTFTISIGASAGTTETFLCHPGATSTDLSIQGVFQQGGAAQNAMDGTPAGGGVTWQDGISFHRGLAYTDALFQNFDDSTLIPGYRNQMIAFGHFAIGTSPSPPAYSFEVRAKQTGTPSDFGRSFGDDADPASVIYDLLTGRFGKLGLPTSIIDHASFDAASAILAGEGNGYSHVIESSTDGDRLIQDVLRQIDGSMYFEPTTGLITLKLIRHADIGDINTLDNINPSNASAAGDNWYTIQGWADIPNTVVVSYVNRAGGYQAATQPAENPVALTIASNRVRKLNIQFSGCATSTLARNLAARELAAVARPIVKATLRVDRSFYLKRPGDVVTLTWPELGIDRMVMRVARVNLGRPGASQITLDLISDQTGVAMAAFPPA